MRHRRQHHPHSGPADHSLRAGRGRSLHLRGRTCRSRGFRAGRSAGLRLPLSELRWMDASPGSVHRRPCMSPLPAGSGRNARNRMPSELFQPIKLRDLTLPNRIIIAPMCEFSADDGSASDWHVVHLGHLSLSGAGLLIIEATGVEPREGSAPMPRPLQRRERGGLVPRSQGRALLQRHADRAAARPCRAQGLDDAAGGGQGHGATEEGGWQTSAPSLRPSRLDGRIAE